MAIDKDAAITIIGGGAWGLSTAYHLARAGYTNITVFERGRQIPSPYSAANDLNKIVRAQYDTNFYTDLGLVSKFLPGDCFKKSRFPVRSSCLRFRFYT